MDYLTIQQSFTPMQYYQYCKKMYGYSPRYAWLSTLANFCDSVYNYDKRVLRNSIYHMNINPVECQ